MNKDAIHDLQMLAWNSGNASADMRLLMEGAITLYEDDSVKAPTSFLVWQCAVTRLQPANPRSPYGRCNRYNGKEDIRHEEVWLWFDASPHAGGIY